MKLHFSAFSFSFQSILCQINMATVANGTGKRRALKKRPDTNERNRASMDGENTPVKVIIGLFIIYILML